MRAPSATIDATSERWKSYRHLRESYGAWLVLLGSRVAGWGLAAVAAAVSVTVHDQVTPQAVTLVLGIAAFYWLGFAVNDYCDAAADARDPQKRRRNFFVIRRVSPVTLTCSVLLFEAALLAIFARFDAPGVGAYAFANLGMWGYSARPLRVKNRTGFDLLFGGVFGVAFPYVLPILLTRAQWAPLDASLVPTAFLCGVAGQLRQQIRDYDVDSRTDVTFTTRVGLHVSVPLLRASIAAICALTIVTLSTRPVPMGLVPLLIIALPAVVECLTAGPRRVPFGLHTASSCVAVCYVLVWLVASLLG